MTTYRVNYRGHSCCYNSAFVPRTAAFPTQSSPLHCIHIQACLHTITCMLTSLCRWYGRAH